MFFNNLNEVRSRHQYGPEDIYNVDESGQKPAKIMPARELDRLQE